MFDRTKLRRGMAVRSQDGVQVGRVIDVTADGIIIEKGQFFLRDFPVAFSDISTVSGDDILLARDYAGLRRSDTSGQEGTARGTVGIAGVAAPPPQGGLGLGPTDLTEARMDSAKFQDHGRYDVRPTGTAAATEVDVERPRGGARPGMPVRDEPLSIPPPSAEPAIQERRAAGPGWDPLNVDEEDREKEAPRTGGPDTKPPTRY